VLNADLHCHSTFSDGVLAPPVLAHRACANGVQLWALTDHDSVSGIAQAREAAKEEGMAFVAGVEISVTWAGRTLHIVGLGIDEDSPELCKGLQDVRLQRHQRALSIAEKLAQQGIEAALEGAMRYVRNPDLVSRTHFARYIHDLGVEPTMQAIFDRYLGEGAPAYVPTEWVRLHEALHWIKSAQGVAVLAHPGRYRLTDLELDALLKQFKQGGGHAIEVNTGSHTAQECERFARIAHTYDLLASVGSDFHGPGESHCELGAVSPLPKYLKPVWHALGY
jgi:3',5'-nucleoside bisphosphate phosphatase